MADAEQNLESLLERSSGTDVPLLLKAKEDAKRRVKEDPSSANLAALDRATQMLRDAMSNQDGGNFGKVKDVLIYLTDQGRKISQAQLYKDLRLGFLRRQKDGSFSRRDVDQYASSLKLVAMPEKEADAMSDLARQELEEKVAKTREQRLAISFDRKVKEGRYILREDVSLELASRATALDVGLRSVIRLYAPDYIRMVGGNPTKAEELITAFEKNLDAALTEYSRPLDFKVEYVPDTTNVADAPDRHGENDGESDDGD